jgi:hypothetical protein
MKNHAYSDYLDDEQFLEVVDQYTETYNNDFAKIKIRIATEVSSHLQNAHGDSYDINDYLSQAKSLIDVLQYINNTINEEVS